MFDSDRGYVRKVLQVVSQVYLLKKNKQDICIITANIYVVLWHRNPIIGTL